MTLVLVKRLKELCNPFVSGFMVRGKLITSELSIRNTCAEYSGTIPKKYSADISGSVNYTKELLGVNL